MLVWKKYYSSRGAARFSLIQFAVEYTFGARTEFFLRAMKGLPLPFLNFACSTRTTMEYNAVGGGVGGGTAGGMHPLCEL